MTDLLARACINCIDLAVGVDNMITLNRSHSGRAVCGTNPGAQHTGGLRYDTVFALQCLAYWLGFVSWSFEHRQCRTLS